jgi:hypothetical protein
MEFLIFWIAMAIATSIVAGNRGYSSGGWFVLGFLFGPLALIIILVKRSKKLNAAEIAAVAAAEATPVGPQSRELLKDMLSDKQRNGDSIRCPGCNRWISYRSMQCVFCGHEHPSVWSMRQYRREEKLKKCQEAGRTTFREWFTRPPAKC